MKKIILSVIFVVMIFIGGKAEATLNNMMSSTLLANWQDMCDDSPINANCADLYTYVNNGGSDVRSGMRAAILCNVTGNAAYCETAYQRAFVGPGQPCYVPGSYDEDYYRRSYVECSIMGSMIGNYVTSDEKSTILAILQNEWNIMGVNSSGGCKDTQNRGACIVNRPYEDIDKVYAGFFGAMIHARIIQSENPTLYSEITTNLGLSISSGKFPRNLISSTAGYWYDGTNIDGSGYNLNEIGEYLIMPTKLLSDSYGVDYFPEITSRYNRMADYILNNITPDLASNTPFGDVQTDYYGFKDAYWYPSFFPFQYVTTGTRAANFRYLATYYQSTAFGSSYNDTPILFRTKGTETAPSGAQSIYDSAMGQSFLKQGFNPNDSMAFLYNRQQHGADHDYEMNRSIRLYRKGRWYLDNPVVYEGFPFTASPNFQSGLLISGILPRLTTEFKAPVAHHEYSDSKAIYSSMLAGGNNAFIYGNQSAGQCPPETIREWRSGLFYRHNLDGSDSFVIDDRLKATSPAPYINLWGTCNNPQVSQFMTGSTGAPDGGPYDHIFNIYAPFNFTNQGSGRLTGSYNGETVYWDTKIATNQWNFQWLLDDGAGSGSSLPKYKTDSNGVREERPYGLYRNTLHINKNETFNNFVNFVHVGSNPTTSAINSVGGQAATMAYYEAGTENVGVVFSRIDPTYPSPTAPNSQGHPAYDSNRINVINQLSKITSDTTFNLTTDGNVILYVMDLDPTLSWKYTVDSGTEQSLTVDTYGSSNNVTLSLTSGSHVLRIYKSGAAPTQTCVDSCSLCNSSNCLSTGPSCYLWSDNTCNSTSDPVVCTTSNLSVCSQAECSALTGTHYWCDDDQNGISNCQSTACATTFTFGAENDADCLVAYNFSEASGNVLDRCTTDAISDDATVVAMGTRDGATYTFNGSSYTSTPTSSELDLADEDFSACIKYHLTNIILDQTLFQKGNTGAGGIRYNLEYELSKLSGWIDDNVVAVQATNPVSPTSGTEYFDCSVRNTSTGTLAYFSNGTQVGTTSETSTGSLLGQSGRPLMIGVNCDSTGCPSSSSPNYANMVIDDFFIFGRALSAANQLQWVNSGGLSETATVAIPTTVKTFKSGTVKSGTF